MLGVAERAVQLTVNGQQYAPASAGVAAAFGYYGAAAHPTLLSLSPSSGPVEGGTILRLATAHVDGGLTLLDADPRTLTLPAASTSAYRCFLSTLNVTAELVNETVRCTTPPFDDDDPRHAAGAALPLHFSANAQDAVGPPARFVLYGVPTIRAAAPLSGPIAGGTLVVLDGAALGNGSDYRCRFGDGAPVDEAPGADVVLASFDGDRHAISCVSPPARDGAPGGMELHVSLNSQNYVRAGGLLFNYTAPERPAVLSPTSGPSDLAAALALGTRSA